MHSYSIDTEERRCVIFFIAVLSVIIAMNLSRVLVDNSINIPTYIDGPSSMVIFGILYWLFDNHGWKWGFFRRIGLIKTPNLNGIWEGKFHSSFIDDNSNTNNIGKVKLTIEQSWTKIRMISENEKSVSCSKIAGIAVYDEMGIVLGYQYSNEAKFDSEDTMNCHLGFNKLRYLNGCKLEGNYFTDRNRKTYGTLEFKFIERVK